MNRLVFFLAPDEEDIMMPLVPEYWKARQQGEQALEAIRPRIWETWHAKFPIDFLALTGHYSTKEDDSDCRRRKLRCIKRYLLRLGTITAGYSVEVVRNAVIHLESQGDGFLPQPLSPEVATDDPSETSPLWDSDFTLLSSQGQEENWHNAATNASAFLSPQDAKIRFISYFFTTVLGGYTLASQGETAGTIVSGTLENGGAETMAPVDVRVKRGVGFCEGVGLGLWGGVSATTTASWGGTVGVIVSSTLENGGDEKMAPIRAAVQHGWGIFVGVGVGTLDAVSATIALSWGKTVGTIVSGTLENGGAEKTAPVCLAVRRGWGVFVGMGSGSLGAAWGMIAVSWGEYAGIIISSTLENGEEEMAALIGAVVE
ncbi:hypothetical protein ARMSODRAFT_974466 [Armillaria solidipes]|uniref:Uncharacterized protein n=1 Tax=Armillaria solidipes TaxID=1076256 RepID=A0A2H3BU57_9AGAR|nr:hypothetical protein ARMSODRAFT_974466 [Armillaria solidipes]